MAIRKFNAIQSAQFKKLMGDKPEVVRADGSVHATGEVHDGQGLVLVVGEKAQRAWTYRYRFDGKSRELGLGSAHKLGLAAAREAREAADALVASKVDPKAVRDMAKANTLAMSRRSETSFHELAKQAVKNPMVCEVTGDAARKQWVASLAPHLCAGVTAKAPQDITRDDVALAIMAIRERGSINMANKVVRRFHAVFEWCAGKGYIDENAANPATFDGRFQFKLAKVKTLNVGHASIPYREAPAVAAALRVKLPRTTALCCEWVLLTAVRASNATTAQWTEIDRVAKVWTIPASKMKVDGHGAHKVPLTDRMLEILDELAPPAGVNGSELLFPGASDTGPQAQTMRQVLRAVYPKLIEREDGSLRKAAVHGLRATFRTWGENQLTADGGHRFDEKTLELCLAHVVGDAARNAYVKENNVEVRRVVMNEWSAYLSGNVVALRKAA